MAASVALHAFLFAALPALVRDGDPLDVHTLEVVLLPPKPLLAEASPRPDAVAAPEPVRSRWQTRKKQSPRRMPILESPAPELHPRSIAKSEKSVPPQVALPAPESGLKTERPAPESAAASTPASAPASAPVLSAAYLYNPPPRYPLLARRKGEQGTVTLMVLVTREGTPASVKVERTSGSARLDEAAAEAVRKWRFVPARQGDQPVEAWLLVPIVFRLEGTS